MQNSKIQLKSQKLLPIFFILIAASLRVLRYFGVIDLPPNFAPIAAIALFAGAYLKDRRLAILIPLSAMIISDIFIGFYNLNILIAVYGSFVLAGLIGFFLRKKRSVWKVGSAAVAASLIFFLITNMAVWLFSGIYAQTFFGLYQSYLMALPFFKWTILGNLFYVGVLFGVYELVIVLHKRAKYNKFLIFNF